MKYLIENINIYKILLNDTYYNRRYRKKYRR